MYRFVKIIGVILRFHENNNKNNKVKMRKSLRSVGDQSRDHQGGSW